MKFESLLLVTTYRTWRSNFFWPPEVIMRQSSKPTSNTKIRYVQIWTKLNWLLLNLESVDYIAVLTGYGISASYELHAPTKIRIDPQFYDTVSYFRAT